MIAKLFNKRKILLIILLSCILFVALYFLCQNYSIANGNDQKKAKDTYFFPYDLESPDKTYTLPDYLYEISGLSYYKKNKIVCVQDERAKLFIYDLKEKEITDKYEFGKDGDFEGVEMVDKKIYVLRSDGKIYSVKDFKKDDYKKKEYETPLSGKNDCEGLCYDTLSNSLLIACKGSPSLKDGKAYKRYKAIYSFDLEEKELITTPFFLIDLDEILDLDKLTAYERASHKLANELDESGDVRFQPSGIAIHPITGNIYIIGAIGNRLIVINRSNDILTIERFDKDLFKQPEGICFKPNGDLYISNEGHGGKAKILKFKYIAK